MVVSRVIDTGLILAAVFFALSVVVSNINEQIAALLKWRGANLYSGVLNLLSGSLDLTQALFQHPLIASAQCDADGKVNPKEQYRPSYIGARDFSVALWQSVASAAPQAPAAGTAAAQSGAAVTYALSAAAAGPSLAMDALQGQVKLLPSEHLRATLFALLGQAQGDYQRLLQVTDAWFNRQMDRVSGWYRRKTQYAVMVISVVLVIFLGVDTIRITTRIYADDALRSVYAPRVAATIESSAPGNSSALPTAQQQQKLLDALDDPSFVGTLVSGPIFLDGSIWSAKTNPWPLGIHLLGVVVTMVALSLGAPFWFDALQFFANSRLAGPKPSTASSSQPQGS
jgi:hypothetical protein